MNERVDHLERAKVYIGKGEEYYRRAAEEIVAAKKADFSLTDAMVGEALGRSRQWVSKLIAWVEKGADHGTTPFSGPEENEARYQRHDRRKVSEIAQERPEAVAEAITKADPETQRKIAAAIVKADPEPALSDAIAPPTRKPAPGIPTWRRLEKATFTLWEVGQDLMDQAPADEQKVRMVGAASQAAALAAGIVALLSTGEIDEDFRALLAEVDADGEAVAQ